MFCGSQFSSGLLIFFLDSKHWSSLQAHIRYYILDTVLLCKCVVGWATLSTISRVVVELMLQLWKKLIVINGCPMPFFREIPFVFLSIIAAGLNVQVHWVVSVTNYQVTLLINTKHWSSFYLISYYQYFVVSIMSKNTLFEVRWRADFKLLTSPR